MPYKEEIPYLRFPLIVDNRDQLISYMRKHDIYLGIWYADIIDPRGSDLQRLHYKKSNFAKAESVASHIVNLPTYPVMDINDAKRIVELLQDYEQRSRDN